MRLRKRILLAKALPLLLLPLVALCAAAAESIPAPATDVPSNMTLSGAASNATAAMLVRPRRQPPYTIIKHISRSSKRGKPRRRYKRPKITYGPPGYNYGEPITHYKTRKPSAPPAYSLDDFQHLNFDAADFDLPPSSYEGQAMDLDFYSHGDAGAPHDHYPTIELEEPSGYSYAAPPPKSSPPQRTPHPQYGVPSPAFDYASGYAHSQGGGGGPHYSAPSYESAYNEPTYHETALAEPPPPPPHQPASDYGPPPPSGPPHDSYAPPTIYDKTLPNAGYADQHGFAEPPPPPPTTYGGGGIEISVAPSYEISLPTAPPPHPPASSYESPSQTHGGHFAEPPPPPHPPPSHSGGDAAPEYLPPSQELPLNPHHKQPAYNFPKSSYEVPIYDPIPFDASNVDERELYPPHPIDLLRDGAGREDSNNIEPNDATGDSEYAPTAEAPQAPDDDSDDDDSDGDDKNSAGSAPVAATEKPYQPVRQHQRKRVRGGSGSGSGTPTKHTLDTPELEQAFEANQRQKFHADEGSTLPYPNVESYDVSDAWNPMRIRFTPPPSTAAYAPTVATAKSSSAAAPTTALTTRNRRRPAYKQRPARQPAAASSMKATATATTAAASFPNAHTPTGLTILSIEQSRSQSYYDGTVSPPSLSAAKTNAPQTPRLNRFKVQSRTAAQGGGASGKRTTAAFETTYFKTPRSDRELQQLQHAASLQRQQLPRNHKPY